METVAKMDDLYEALSNVNYQIHTVLEAHGVVLPENEFKLLKSARDRATAALRKHIEEGVHV